MAAELLEAREFLVAGLAELSIDVSGQQLDALTRLAQLVETWSQRVNLSGHRTAAEIAHRLVLDAAALGLHLGAPASLADIGSGAGFPGLPLAILHPDCSITLVESRERRHHFQRAAIRDLGLANTTALLGRAEALSPSPCQVSVAQAVAAPADALPLLLPWTAIGGLMAFPGGAIPAAAPESPCAGFRACVHYRVPCEGPQRTLWLAQRHE